MKTLRAAFNEASYGKFVEDFWLPYCKACSSAGLAAPSAELVPKTFPEAGAMRTGRTTDLWLIYDDSRQDDVALAKVFENTFTPLPLPV
jgi:hypothetical protein